MSQNCYNIKIKKLKKINKNKKNNLLMLVVMDSFDDGGRKIDGSAMWCFCGLMEG